MTNARGFSLLELLIVVAVIGLIAAIAIPNLLAARRSANEGSAVSSLRTLYGANVTFAATTGNGSYAGTASTVDASSLAVLGTERLIDASLAGGTKSGYIFLGSWEPSSATVPATFYFSTNPAVTLGLLISGTKRYGVATDGVIKSDAVQANLSVPFDATTLAAAIPLE
jgi:prepilin-type N-terminal cleavage/methylation domain-containing protein